MGQGVTTGVYGTPAGHAPIGPLSPGVESLHPTIAGMFLNLQNRFSWAAEMLNQRADGKLPNLAPPNVEFVARRIRSVPPQAQGGLPVDIGPITSGPKWLGAEGPA